MGGIGVIVNPRARHNQEDPRAAHRLALALGDHGVVRTTRSPDDLARVAEDFRRLQIDVLGISGGDGTTGVTLTSFLEVYAGEPLPPLALLRGGTFNTVANAVGVPRGRPERLLSGLVARYAARGREPLRLVQRGTLRVGAQHGFLFGTGAIHGFISEYNKQRKRNVAWAAEVLARATAKVAAGEPTPVAERWEGQVTLDDGTVFPRRDYLAIGAGTVDQIGLGFRPFYRFDAAPGRFHILGIHGSAGGFVQRLPDIWRARPMGPEQTYDELTRRAVIEQRGGVVRYMCDGDVYDHPGPLVLEAGPSVRILLGPRQRLRPLGGLVYRGAHERSPTRT